MRDYSTRLRAVQQKMIEQKIDLLFLQRSANLHYLTGIPREEQNFGNTMYPGEWLSGAWIAPDRAPILSIPRMLADFHLSVTGYDLRVLSDSADPAALAGDLMNALGTAAAATIISSLMLSSAKATYSGAAELIHWLSQRRSLS